VEVAQVAGNLEAAVPAEEVWEIYSANYWVAVSPTLVARSILNPPQESLRIC
jgi:hypothetical protein